MKQWTIIQISRRAMQSSTQEMDMQHRSMSMRLIDKPVEQRVDFLTRMKEYWCMQVQTSNRTIYFNQVVVPLNPQNNLVKNTKYNLLTFIPLVLFNQFKFFFNMFFLVTALTQLVEVLRVGLFLTFIGPLIMVLGLTMAKEAYDDYRTYLRDIEANSQKYQVLRESGVVEVKSKDLKVGDIVRIKGGDRIPADMVTLRSEEEQGTLFLKTDQLDGETDWKLRKAIKKTQSLSEAELFSEEMRCDVKPPSGEIYNFSGLFASRDSSEKLTLENTLWASTVLANGSILGLVIYVGRQTRTSLGASTARTKFGILDLEINFLSKMLFLVMVILTLTFVLLQSLQLDTLPIQFMRMLILLSSIIPISMRVNLDFAKLFYAYNINKDETIEETVTRNSNCPQELGRVKYILSDKTGTLTQNEMLFRQISIEDEMKFTDEQVEDMKDIIRVYDDVRERDARENSLKQIVTALALCHNVTPTLDQKGKDFQASSPDQITFVKMTQKFGLSLQQRTQNSITLKTHAGRLISYQILYIFPFKSETKRMGIILKHSGDYIFYLKGADAVMKEFVTSKQKRAFIQEECKDLSMTGLRTLVFTKKKISKEFYEAWSNRYENAYNKLEIDTKEIEKIMWDLEHGVQFLGITGIEDKLQNSLKQTIESLRSASIKMWMITGDKIETAECIGRSCGLQQIGEVNVKIEETTSQTAWTEKWEEVKENIERVLIIDGKTLAYILDDQQISSDFFATAMRMPAVICCRCSPSQKRVLTEGVKKHRGKNQAVLGIGDGGNDVGMIQAADVGVGIVGKEGKQAALAADFSILEFKHLKTLLLWHGRLSYKRSALLASFIIHRGFIVSVMQLCFSCIFYFASIPVFNSYLQLGYATIFTFWPVFSLILDTDLNRLNALKYPRLYASLQMYNPLSLQAFLSWIWKASFQGTVIMVLTLAFFKDESYIQLETVCFSILILTQYCLTLSEINRIHLLTVVCVVGSILCYFLCVLLLGDYLHVSSLGLVDFIFILSITGISWGPMLVWKIIRKRFMPTDYEKVMKTVRREFLAKDILGKSGIQGANLSGII